ncbi:PAS domain S-box protein [Rufibacter tibetensis]|uniref:histidine kinase n=1 Tax=Rufibacter tibetensis TaxID=512763 RepID=A0A0P0C5E4_9BACT|nr:PAS domain S-box protein [Rufibacter tibetensis]ALJ00148.1 hypothetical protein DC20_15685 [Rufibacter tibetensis]
MNHRLLEPEGVDLPEPTPSAVNFEMMYALAEYSHEPKLLLWPNGEILFVNQAMCQLVGHSKEFLLQEGRKVLVDRADTRWEPAIQERENVGFFRGELNILHRDGYVLPVELDSRLLYISDGTSFVSVHIRDLRAEKRDKQKIEKQQKQLESALHDLSLVLDSTADLICTFSLDGHLLHINKACFSILGYTPEEMIGKHYRNFIHPEDIPDTEGDTLQVVQKYSTINFRNRYLHKDGTVIYFSWSSSLIKEEKKVYCIARNISQEIASEEKHHENENRLQALLQEGYDMICVLNKEGTYSFVSGSVKQVLGYESEELTGANAFDFIHPEDIPHVLVNFDQVLLGDIVQTKPFRFVSKTGEWRWIETKGVNCFHNPAISGIIINSRDITHRLEAQFQLEQSEKLYKALFENNPDSVFSLNKNGVFTSVNAATVACSGYSEEQLLQMNFVQLLHPDWVKETEGEFSRALAGESKTTETEILTALGERLSLSITKVPIIVNDEVLGIHVIAKDITKAKQQQRLLENTAKRLNTILESINDAFFTLDKDWCFSYVNHEFEKAMGVSNAELLGRDIRVVYSANDYEIFYSSFSRAILLQHPAHFEVFSENLNRWLDVSAYPSEEGLAVFIRAIDARKKVEAELKKLSLVASKTVNSVYITDDEGHIEWVNEGFTRVTGYTLEEVIGRRPGDFLAGPDTDQKKVSRIREKLHYNRPFVQEVQNRSKKGEVYWSKLDITPILDDQNGGGKKFIVIETVITEQKKAEEERAKLTDELLRRNRNLEQFTYIVSHNLRSPVANILGLTSLLTTKGSAELQEGITERLNQTAQNLDSIIRDLNEMLNLQAGMLDAKDHFQLSEVVNQVLQVLPIDSFEKVEVNLNGIQEIISIRSYVSSIISNLLTNAIKYKNPDKPLRVCIKAELHQDDMVCLSVTDNGLGINLEKEGKNLFGMYKRFHFHVSGRGLGLYLVKTQAEALGGYVKVESKPNQGSTFKVWIKNYS